METKKVNNKKNPNYKRIKDLCVDLYYRDPSIEMRLVRGRVFINSRMGEMMFIQNGPRGPRSVEIGRTLHSRSVRRPDGKYTVTFRCGGDEKNLKKMLTAEVNEIATMIKRDVESMN